MQAVGKQMPDGLKKKIVGWAKRTMLAYQVELQVGGSGAGPFGVGVARKLLVKARLLTPNSQLKTPNQKLHFMLISTHVSFAITPPD